MNRSRNKAKEWGRKKFIPKTKNQICRPKHFEGEDATPWGVFQSEMVQKQKDEERNKAMDAQSEEAKKIFKQRDENYRRMLITEKRSQPTQWETFDDDNTTTPAPSKKSKDMNKGEKKKQQKNIKNIGGNNSTKPIVSEELVKDFDSRKLNFKQNNTFRKALTKGHTKMQGGSLDSMLHELKDKKLLKKKIKNKQ